MKCALLLAMVLFASVAQAASPEGTRTPRAAFIDDGYGGTWTLDPDGAVLRNGYRMVEGSAWQILLYSNSIYVLTAEARWQRFVGNGWVDVERDPQASAEGTRTPPGTFINDNYGGIWTIGSGGETLRNGHFMAGGHASQLLLFSNSMFALGTDGAWWRFAGTSWVYVGADPQLQRGQEAMPAAAFVDSVGITTHFNYLDTAYYQQWERIKQLLLESKIRHIRDGVVGMVQWYYDRINSLYELGGIRNMTILGMPDNVEQAIASAVASMPAVEAIEALNEWDLFGGDDWIDDVRTFQPRFFKAMKRNPDTARLGVVGPSVTTLAAAQAVGDVGRSMDRANLHNYYSTRNPETLGWGDGGYGSLPWSMALSRTLAPNTTIWTTETGYHTGPGAMPEAIVARYLPRLLLSHFAAGIERTYLYQLADTMTAFGPIDTFAFTGLIKADGTPKASYYAVKSLISILDDRGASFVPGRLAYVATGASRDLRQVLLQKQDGTFYLALWLDHEGMDPATFEMRRPTYEDVTVSFAQASGDITIYTIDDGGDVSEHAIQGGQIVSVTVGENVQLLRIPVSQ